MKYKLVLIASLLSLAASAEAIAQCMHSNGPQGFDTIAESTLTWAIIAAIASLIALIISTIGIYTNRLFPRLTDAEHLDTTESFVRSLIDKSDETIQSLSDECSSVASQLEVQQVRNIEMNNVMLRTRYFQDVTRPKLFEVMVLSRIAIDKKKHDAFFRLSDTIEKVNAIQEAALRDFFDFDEKFERVLDDIAHVTIDLVQLSNQIQAPLTVGDRVIVQPDTFEMSFMFVFTAWVNGGDGDGEISADSFDAYHLAKSLFVPMRRVSSGFKTHQHATYLIGLVTTFDYHFDKLNNLKNRYVKAFKQYSDRLLEHKQTIAREAAYLLSQERTDFDYKVRIIRKLSGK